MSFETESEFTFLLRRLKIIAFHLELPHFNEKNDDLKRYKLSFGPLQIFDIN